MSVWIFVPLLLMVIVSRGFSDFLCRTVSTHYERSKHVKKAGTKQAKKCLGESLARKIELGQHALSFVKERKDDKFVQRVLDNDRTAIMPNNFWRDFVQDELGLVYNTRNRLRCFRALQLIVKRSCGDRKSATAKRDGDKGTAKRKRGSEKNATKGKGLGHALLTFFIDEIQSLHSRADSVMLLDKLREHHATLIKEGFLESELPKVEGRAGIQWLYRWRIDNKISRRSGGMQLKVAWSKILRRCTVCLTNIFRIQALWEIVHPGRGAFQHQNDT